MKAINDIRINEVKYENQLKLNEERNNVKIASIKEEKTSALFIYFGNCFDQHIYRFNDQEQQAEKEKGPVATDDDRSKYCA